MAMRNSTAARMTVTRTYFSAVTRYVTPSSNAWLASLPSSAALFGKRVLVARHVPGSRGSVRIRERLGGEPGLERHLVLRREAAFQYLGKSLVP